MMHRPDFRRAIAFVPVSLAVLGVLSLFVPEKKPGPVKRPKSKEKSRDLRNR